jgi:hypothetical protein
MIDAYIKLIRLLALSALDAAEPQIRTLPRKLENG